MSIYVEASFMGFTDRVRCHLLGWAGYRAGQAFQRDAPDRAKWQRIDRGMRALLITEGLRRRYGADRTRRRVPEAGWDPVFVPAPEPRWWGWLDRLFA